MGLFTYGIEAFLLLLYRKKGGEERRLGCVETDNGNI